MTNGAAGINPDKAEHTARMRLEQTIWLGLAVLAAAWSALLGVPIWLTLGALFCAVLPPIAAVVLRQATSGAAAAEIESALWIAAATFATASTGGVSALLVLYGVAVAVAWGSGKKRLTAEMAGFALLGLASALIAGASGGWIPAPEARVLSGCYGVSALIILVVMAITSTSARTSRLEPRTDPGRSARSVDRDLKDVEARLAAAAAAIREARAQAAAANERLEARTTFFAQTSHELRTPLNAIVGFAEMMRDAVFGPLPDRYQEYAELIHEGGQNLTLIVDDVLDLARIEAGRYEIDVDLVSLTDLAADAVNFMRHEAIRKGIDLSLAGGQDAEAFADAKAVRQIALNLISNALKFTPKGGRVEVGAIEIAGGSILSVTDNGVGISPEELTRLSRTFEQGNAGKRHKGSGLGLSVVRAFASLHGGALTIDSREGGGTRISVFFPGENIAASEAAGPG